MPASTPYLLKMQEYPLSTSVQTSPYTSQGGKGKFSTSTSSLGQKQTQIENNKSLCVVPSPENFYTDLS